jgi:hypothetical protein
MIVFYQSLNLGFLSVFAPFIAQLPSISKQAMMLNSTSFPLVMFVVIIGQAIAGNLLRFLLRFFLIKQKFCLKLYQFKLFFKNPLRALDAIKGRRVPFSSSFAFMTKIYWFGFFYAVISPICLLISTLGMFMFYQFQRILLNYRFSIPTYGGVKINYSFLNLLDWTPFWISMF